MTENKSGDAKVYPFASKPDQEQATRDEVQGLFDAKKAKNIASGQTAYQSGEYKPFEGFGRQGMENLFVLEIELDEASRREIAERVVKPIKEIAERLGISEMYFAGEKDQDPHITLHVGRFDKMTPEEKESVKGWLEGNASHLRWASDILTGLKFQIDTVVASGRDTYIAAGKAEGNQGAAFRVRKVFDRALERAQAKLVTTPDAKIGPHYARYDDIFHISIARFGNKVEPDRLQTYAGEVNAKVGKELAENPLTIKAEIVTPRIATIGVEKRKPELLI